MLIAFISDIHGNLPALKAVAEEAKGRGVNQIICAGDVIGNGPFPSEVCSYLEENNIATISGNYDCKALNVIQLGKPAAAKLQRKKRELLIWTAKHINKSAEHFLELLPQTLEEPLPGGRRLLVVHGSPISNDDDIYPSITAEGFKVKLGDIHPDILVCGHTHIPFIKRIGGVLIVNCGSAGQPVDGDPRPSYAVVSIDENAVNAHIIRFDYNVSEVVAALKNTSLPKGVQKDFADGTKRRFLE
jgi:predicted phosphodiesterase